MYCIMEPRQSRYLPTYQYVNLFNFVGWISRAKCSIVTVNVILILLCTFYLVSDPDPVSDPGT
jgi:hypothetical protein